MTTVIVPSMMLDILGKMEVPKTKILGMHIWKWPTDGKSDILYELQVWSETPSAWREVISSADLEYVPYQDLYKPKGAEL